VERDATVASGNAAARFVRTDTVYPRRAAECGLQCENCHICSCSLASDQVSGCSRQCSRVIDPPVPGPLSLCNPLDSARALRRASSAAALSPSGWRVALAADYCLILSESRHGLLPFLEAGLGERGSQLSALFTHEYQALGRLRKSAAVSIG